VRLTDIPDLTNWDIDILCIGKEIVDAGLLDMKLDVLQEEFSWD
jgi:nicotinate-nucleotide pyrophosphorylase (carboxylating)